MTASNQKLNIKKEVRALERMTPAQLRAKYEEVYGEASRSGNKAFLIKRIAWRLQARAEGDLPERVRRHAIEMADDADLRLRPPDNDEQNDRTAEMQQNRLPNPLMPGTVLTRQYKGELLEVRVLGDGYEFKQKRYRSLSAIAREITGAHWNGKHFFGVENLECAR